MIGEKEIMEMLFPKWLRFTIVLIIGTLLGIAILKSIDTFSYLWGIIVGLAIGLAILDKY